jgi:N-acetylglutamate synthase-like GNAT family acetyltransferase
MNNQVNEATDIRPRIEIDYLANKKHLIPQIASLLWGYFDYTYVDFQIYDIQGVENDLERQSRADQAPCNFVATIDGKLVGTANLEVYDIPSDPRFPWLAAVGIIPEMQGKGIVGMLVRAIFRKAKELNYPHIHVWTEDKVELYEHYGFKILEQKQYLGRDITILKKDLAEE